MTQEIPVLDATFEFQRQWLETAQRLARNSAHAQQQLNDTAVEATTATTSVQRQWLDAAARMSEQTQAAMSPQQAAGIDLDALFEELLAQYDENTHIFETTVREGAEQAEVATNQFQEAVDEQFDVLLQAHREFHDQSRGAWQELTSRYDATDIPVDGNEDD